MLFKPQGFREAWLGRGTASLMAPHTQWPPSEKYQMEVQGSHQMCPDNHNMITALGTQFRMGVLGVGGACIGGSADVQLCSIWITQKCAAQIIFTMVIWSSHVFIIF